ncbi:GPI anchor biosynthesis protein [Niveomyces insectorum RCEF 264]|uniref:GPI-anchored wall transfer protein n=1 Tax=Niveomyces insectorum RCEF 264 TaxID=1081102 RepID=A0A167NA69_9HYPO|nr:GPI anchor biosynthesis protein [Niveomyces insectorum RCEF 264]
MADSPAAAAATAANHYKKLKEDFVSNLSGGSTSEVVLVTVVAPVAVLTWSVLQRRQSFFRPYTPLAFVVDFLLNVAAILLAITLYANQPLLLNGLLLASALFVVALPRRRRVVRKPKPKAHAFSSTSSPSPGSATSPQPTPKTPPPLTLPKKPFLTTYRGCMMVVTCLAILAVDFRIFPRRFAKVETWGTSLMDMGVGSFVFSAGVVAARPVLKERADCARSQTRVRRPSLGRRLAASLRHALPLFALGVVRLLSVKGLDYAEHVTEYGVHWNFFFTLGLLPPCVAVAQAALRVVPAGSPAVLALLLAGLYQVALAATPLLAYVLTAPRVDLLSKNREGLASFVGYLAIFLAGQDTGLYLLPGGGDGGGGGDDDDKDGRRRRPSSASLWRWVAANRLPLWALAWTGLHAAATSVAPYGLGLTESRRLANLPYVLWVLAFNTQQLTLFALVDRLVVGRSPDADAVADAARDAAHDAAHDAATSTVLRAYNRNGLFLFLVANLLTGLVNLTVPTLDVRPAAALGLLLAYGGVLTALAVALEVRGITLKL